MVSLRTLGLIAAIAGLVVFRKQIAEGLAGAGSAVGQGVGGAFGGLLRSVQDSFNMALQGRIEFPNLLQYAEASGGGGGGSSRGAGAGDTASAILDAQNQVLKDQGAASTNDTYNDYTVKVAGSGSGVSDQVVTPATREESDLVARAKAAGFGGAGSTASTTVAGFTPINVAAAQAAGFGGAKTVNTTPAKGGKVNTQSHVGETTKAQKSSVSIKTAKAINSKPNALGIKL